METYEKKYKDLEGKIKKAYLYAQTDSTKAVLEEILPELAESEDEKIKREIIKYIKTGTYHKDWIAWLEKQQSVEEIVARCKDSWYNEGKIAGMAEGLSDDEKYQQGWHDALKKQGEKPQGKTALEAWKDMSLEVYAQASGNKHEPNCSDNNTKMFSLNDIDEIIEKINEQMKKANNANKVEPKFKVKYAGREYNVLEIKESAGVTFYGIEDEPNHIDYVLPDDCEIISGYGEKEKGSPYPTKPAIFSEQNSALSEEDKNFMHDTLSNLTELKDRYGEGYGNVGKCIEWLKSLKERVQPQNNSITDEELEQAKKDAYNDALDKIEYHSGEPTFADGWHAAIDCIKKKSFKPNLQWKPSEEQMECLHDAVEHYHTNGYPASKLNELYEQMSKIYKL